MLGLMQHHPLLISSLLDHAEGAHRSAQIVSIIAGEPAHRCGYADIARRARQVAQALTALGIREGDRVGTMAWNAFRHLDALGLVGLPHVSWAHKCGLTLRSTGRAGTRLLALGHRRGPPVS
jgi:hypothetical protein